ncbi:TetR/AcrR family transcriptional regulator [Streptomyces sp. WAC04770]|nr:TetR/AcrR family transcriptional regulator [Streptomyces sp. WAC04770]RST20765.1 TetR/AcrR family transcriptional regulator [Streptomyces sp. WAC04770]
MATDTPTMGRPRGFDEEAALDLAVEVFWRQGYEGTSISDLTDAMGINRPSLYATYGNKEQLFHRAFDRYRKTKTAYIANAFEQPTAYAVIESFLRGSADALTADGHPLGCLSVQGGLACSPRNAGIPDALAAGRATTERALAQRLARATQDGDLQEKTDPQALARFVMILSEGFAVHATAGTEPADLHASIDIALQSVTALCSPPPRPDHAAGPAGHPGTARQDGKYGDTAPAA